MAAISGPSPITSYNTHYNCYTCYTHQKTCYYFTYNILINYYCPNIYNTHLFQSLLTHTLLCTLELAESDHRVHATGP